MPACSTIMDINDIQDHLECPASSLLGAFISGRQNALFMY